MTSSYNIDTLQSLGFLFAGLFLILGLFDGIYFHLIKYKLHLYPESALEHRIHSARGILLGVIGYALFSAPIHGSDFNPSKIILALPIIALDLALEVLDIYIEKKSRAHLGGISSTEMVLHVFASSFRMAAIVLLIIVALERGFSQSVNLVGSSISVVAALIGAAGFLPQVPVKIKRDRSHYGRRFQTQQSFVRTDSPL